MSGLESQLRHRCRNPRCQMKLGVPTEQARDAFCTRGCHDGYYRRRCMVCEREMKRRVEHQRVCGRHKCRADFRANRTRFTSRRYLALDYVASPTRNPIKPGPKWRTVAGPQLSDTALRLATLPLDPATEARHKREHATRWDAHWRRVEDAALFQRHSPPANILGGYRFPGAPKTGLEPRRKIAPSPYGEGLDIPDFLRRPST